MQLICDYNMARVLALYNCCWAAMNKIFIYARPCINKMTWAFFFTWLQSFRPVMLQCSFPSLWNMEETSEELPNFSIGIDLLGPDPTSKKQSRKKLASCTFRKFVARPAAANFGRKTFAGNSQPESSTAAITVRQNYCLVVAQEKIASFLQSVFSSCTCTAA